VQKNTPFDCQDVLFFSANIKKVKILFSYAGWNKELGFCYAWIKNFDTKLKYFENFCDFGSFESGSI
jgi:hypothetical protein